MSSSAKWTTNTWWVLTLSSATRSKAIVPGRARCAGNRDAQDARGPRQSGSAKFLPYPCANPFPSKPRGASPGPTVLPKWVDGLHCAAGALRGRAPTWFSPWCRQRPLPRFPDRCVGFDAHYILQSEFRQVGAELGTLPITRICQYHSYRNLLLHGPPYLLQSNLCLC